MSELQNDHAPDWQNPPPPPDAATRAAQRIAELEQRIATLEHQVVTDDLTGLLNRRGFAAAFASEHDRIKRRMSRGGLVVMIDLDGFKAINDTNGHDAGDACLKCVGGLLLRGVRGMDAAARLGGDEFALLLTNTYPDAALTRVQHLSVNLNRHMLPWQGKNLFIGASIGVHAIGLNDTMQDILMQADADMYAQKRASRTLPPRLAQALQNNSRGPGVLNPQSVPIDK